MYIALLEGGEIHVMLPCQFHGLNSQTWLNFQVWRLLRGSTGVRVVGCFVVSCPVSYLRCASAVFFCLCKGQLISKFWCVIDSPKKRTDDFFCQLFYSWRQTNQIRSFICFLGESTARQSAFWFYLTLSYLYCVNRDIYSKILKIW